MEKVEFIICVNQEMYKDQCVAFINNLIVPLEIEVSITLIHDADSMASAYNKAMKGSDAKYKIYLHQDVFIVNKKFISEFIEVFLNHPEIGLLGVIGRKNVIKNACFWDAWDVGETYAATPLNFMHLKCSDVSDIEYVCAIDGMLMITQYDVDWREDIFDAFDFYDISQSEEFQRSGYQVAISRQSEVWCIHDCGYSKLQKYDIYREKFCGLYADKYLYEELENQNIKKELGTLENQLLSSIMEYIDNGNIQEVELIFNQVGQMSPENTELVILYVMFCLEQEEKSGETETVVYETPIKSNAYIDTFIKYKFMLQRITYDIPLGEYAGLWNSTMEQYSKKGRLIEKLVQIVSECPQIVLDKMMRLIRLEEKKMYEDYISKLNPEPILNLKWYKNDDCYSEGEIEDLIIKLIAENEPEEYVNAIYNNFSWSTYYHLSHIRKNILNWYPFEEDSNVLEIGCGMGAITGLLCDRCKSVTAVELSKRRAMATWFRCRQKDNLEILVGNINDMEFKTQFDYITLIGVLEYQGNYTDTNNPYQDFLMKVRTLLKPGGKLLIAIENQYGLKYWCGAKEDHTAIPFDGINQYMLSQGMIRTFSKKALTDMIKSSGFKNTFFYYPMPDYKLPQVIYSEQHLPQSDNMHNIFFYYTEKSALIADEKQIYRDVIANNVFDFFANSFLVECTDSDFEEYVSFATMSTFRIPEYQICTRIMNHNRVEKFMISQSGYEHLKKIKENESILEERGLSVLIGENKNGILAKKYIDKPLIEDLIKSFMETNAIENALDLLDRVYYDILKSSDQVSWEENIIYTFDMEVPKEETLYGSILQTGYLDMILRNGFMLEDKILWFDQEWTLENIPASFVMYRAIKYLYISYPEIEKNISIHTLAERYNISKVWNIYDQVENLFQNVVLDEKVMAEYNVFHI